MQGIRDTVPYLVRSLYWFLWIFTTKFGRARRRYAVHDVKVIFLFIRCSGTTDMMPIACTRILQRLASAVTCAELFGFIGDGISFHNASALATIFKATPTQSPPFHFSHVFNCDRPEKIPYFSRFATIDLLWGACDCCLFLTRLLVLPSNYYKRENLFRLLLHALRHCKIQSCTLYSVAMYNNGFRVWCVMK